MKKEMSIKRIAEIKSEISAEFAKVNLTAEEKAIFAEIQKASHELAIETAKIEESGNYAKTEAYKKAEGKFEAADAAARALSAATNLSTRGFDEVHVNALRYNHEQLGRLIGTLQAEINAVDEENLTLVEEIATWQKVVAINEAQIDLDDEVKAQIMEIKQAVYNRQVAEIKHDVDNYTRLNLAISEARASVQSIRHQLFRNKMAEKSRLLYDIVNAYVEIGKLEARIDAENAAEETASSVNETATESTESKVERIDLEDLKAMQASGEFAKLKHEIGIQLTRHAFWLSMTVTGTKENKAAREALEAARAKAAYYCMSIEEYDQAGFDDARGVKFYFGQQSHWDKKAKAQMLAEYRKAYRADNSIYKAETAKLRYDAERRIKSLEYSLSNNYADAAEKYTNLATKAISAINEIDSILAETLKEKLQAVIDKFAVKDDSIETVAENQSVKTEILNDIYQATLAIESAYNRNDSEARRQARKARIKAYQKAKTIGVSAAEINQARIQAQKDFQKSATRILEPEPVKEELKTEIVNKFAITLAYYEQSRRASAYKRINKVIKQAHENELDELADYLDGKTTSIYSGMFAPNKFTVGDYLKLIA